VERLRIVAEGKTEQAQANARGKLFEKIAAEVLRRHGYDIDRHRTNVTHAGMEIDIEGQTHLTRIPLYAECKCYGMDITAEKLQTFFGKYMTQWFKDHKTHGLFMAIPGLNSHAMGFYQENCASNSEITLRLLQEPEILDALKHAELVTDGERIRTLVPLNEGTAGDRLLICSDKGLFWAQYVVPLGSGIASKIQVFDALGHTITDKPTLDYLAALVAEFTEFEIITAPGNNGKRSDDDLSEVVVELQGSSTCFEYQFPASPKFFVGRLDLLDAVQQYILQVLNNTTTMRGLLFEANSGWGKSSLVLTTVSRLRQEGHYAVAYDCRSASTSQFVLKMTQHVLQKFRNFNGALTSTPIVTGFDGAVNALIDVGNALKAKGKLLVIFLDQFENVFYLLDVLTKIAQLCLKITDAQTNIVLGFSWKTDLVGLTREFPYRWRDTIIECSHTVRLKQFSEFETEELLNKLAEELHSTLRKDLRFLLSEFSQGYPWLLKKLCSHVKAQRQAGIAQAEMARGLLNVEQLFLEDLDGLNSDQEAALRLIARLAPVSVSEISDDFSPGVIQSLIDRRLVVRVGTKYDIYWDIFRDYLNTGKLLIEEVYLLRAQVGSILKAVKALQESGGVLEISDFKENVELSDGAFLNVARDLRLLQIATVEDNHLSLLIPRASGEEEIHQILSKHLNDRLLRNRCVHAVLRELHDRGEISMEYLGTLLRAQFPYISAVAATWEIYARILATWLDLSDLAVLDQAKTTLMEYKVGSQIRERRLSFVQKRPHFTAPNVHFGPVLQVAERLVMAAQKNERVDWSGISRSTIYKALIMLEELKLIVRRETTFLVTPECYTFALNPERRREMAKDACLKWSIFKTFVEILSENSTRSLSLKQLGTALIKRCDVDWKIATAEINAKIMLDWARHLNLAPGVHASSQRGRFRTEPEGTQMPLFHEQQNSRSYTFQEELRFNQ
jgi:hypothetical protein